MKFSEVLKTQSADDQAFVRRSLRERECDVCHQSDLCAYLILSDAFVCSAECARIVLDAPKPEQPIVKPPTVEHPIVEPDDPEVTPHEKMHGRSKKA